MALLFDAFLDYGGPWLTLLGVLAWIAYIRDPRSKDKESMSESGRMVEALSSELVMTAGVCISLMAWLWSFGRMYKGYSFLRGAGKFPELSTGLSGVILVLAVVAWWSISWRRIRHLQPWITYGLVLAMIISASKLVADGPVRDLSQGSEERILVRFVQRRLDHLGCFAASGSSKWPVGKFDALTTNAVVAFQQANGLLQEPSADPPGKIRPDCEFRFLARPFPFLFSRPARCPPPGRDAPVWDAQEEHPCR